MLRLIGVQKETEVGLAQRPYNPKALGHHRQLLEGYLQSHVTRNHSPRTITGVRQFLQGWFEEHGGTNEPLYAWEAMAPMKGRVRIVQYGKALIEVELENATIRRYLGHLRDFFSYVLEHPVVLDAENPVRITDVYGPIEQPVSEFDIPQHSYGGDQRGIPLDPERLYDFYGVLREKYLSVAGNEDIGARDYTIAVIAGRKRAAV